MLKRDSMRTRLVWPVWALVMALWLTGCRASPATEKTVGVTLTGLDHLEAHLSIQEFSVNGVSGQQAGGGGSSVCCVSLPAVWRPGLTVKVKWGVTNWPHKAYSWHERVVPVEQYDEMGDLHIHFLRDGSVRAICTMYGAWGTDGLYPGPSYETVLDKNPWTRYKRQPGEPLFTEVRDAAALGGPK